MSSAAPSSSHPAFSGSLRYRDYASQFLANGVSSTPRAAQRPVPLAIERASLSARVLPDPSAVGSSLYAALEAGGNRPVRAVQRISAANLGETDARLLDVQLGSASLRIERISYLASGKAIEFTRSIYRGDAYDFVAELRLSAPSEEKGGRS